MGYAPYGDTIQQELDEAAAALAPVIPRIRDLLLDYEYLGNNDPVILRDHLWRALDAMTVARQHVERAEQIRRKFSPRSTAAQKREKKRKS